MSIREDRFVEMFRMASERGATADRARRQARREKVIAVHGLRSLGLPWSTIATLLEVSREYVRQLDLGYQTQRSAREE